MKAGAQAIDPAALRLSESGGAEAGRLRAARLAVTVLFFANGMLFASWVARIPALRTAHQLSHGQIGLALLAMACGAAIAMPLAGLWGARVGSAHVCRLAALLYCAAEPCLALAPNIACFVAALIVFGAAHGALDVAMNAQAVSVEKGYRRSIMSSFHAWFSGGGLVGAVLGGMLAGWEFGPLRHFCLVAGALGAAVLFVSPRLHVAEESVNAPRAKGRCPRLRPSRPLLLLGVIAFCSMIGEGALADWSALFLRDVSHASEGYAAFGYAAFSIAMSIARVGGDFLIGAWGPVRVLRCGSLLAAGGLLLALLAPNPSTVIAGFACTGLGFAAIVPVVFSAAGRTAGSVPEVAVASVASIGYAGFIVGPPIIGFFAEIVGLRSAMGILVLTSLCSAAIASAVRREEPEGVTESQPCER